MKPENQPIDETWFAAVLAGECDETRLASFKAWLKEDPDHGLTFAAYERLWQQLSPRQAPAFDVFDGWCRLAARLHLGSEVPEAWSLYLREALPPEESAKIDAWRAREEVNEAAFTAYQKLWRATGPDSGPAFDVQGGWAKLAAELDLNAEPTPARSEEGGQDEDNVVAFPARRVFLGTAAGMAAVVLIGFILFFVAPPPGEAKTVRTGPGEQVLITLTDGTNVQLNGNSRLVFTDPMPRGERSVTLLGQAYFEVTHQENAPFRIHTGEATVTVLGTRFDVWSISRRTRVVVRDGRVALSDLEGKGRVELTADQMSYVAAGGEPEPVQEVSADVAISWREGRIVFERARLADALKDLGLAFDSEIVLDDPDLGNRTLSGSFPTDNLESVLGEIGLALNLAYTKRDGVYHIHAR